MRGDYAIIIPARYASSRFPGKPLVDLVGRSMISRVWEKCITAAGKERVYVATDDERILEHCAGQGIKTVETSRSCLTGTDRLYEASRTIEADTYINVQGDEPLISPDDIKIVINKSLSYPNVVINAMCKITDERDFYSLNVPKVVFSTTGNLLYMSRSPIPAGKNQKFNASYKQVCIYAFPKEMLKFYGELQKKSPFESVEDIEILRFIENDIPVSMIEVSSASIAVDTPEDAAKVRARILANEV